MKRDTKAARGSRGGGGSRDRPAHEARSQPTFRRSGTSRATPWLASMVADGDLDLGDSCRAGVASSPSSSSLYSPAALSRGRVLVSLVSSRFDSRGASDPIPTWHRDSLATSWRIVSLIEVDGLRNRASRKQRVESRLDIGGCLIASQFGPSVFFNVRREFFSLNLYRVVEKNIMCDE